MRARVSKEFRFEAAHRLTSREAGPCASVHGHSYCVRVEISGEVDKETGMVVNFRDLGFVKEMLDEWDHKLILNEKDELVEVLGDLAPEEVKFELLPCEPTAENMARILFRQLEYEFITRGRVLESVTVWETLKCSATVRREDM